MGNVDRNHLRIRRIDGMTTSEATQLAEVLIDCVDGDASVSFMHPLEPGRAEAFWRRIGADVARGARILLVAEDEVGIAGTVQVALDLPENQPHRADVAKMLVHRRARRRGAGEGLLRAAEAAAQAAGRSLLVLDTATGSDAERLYRRLGWTLAGVIPDYALFPRGGFCSTSVFYRNFD